jgi:hypothetical protein
VAPSHFYFVVSRIEGDGDIVATVLDEGRGCFPVIWSGPIFSGDYWPATVVVIDKKERTKVALKGLIDDARRTI